LGCKSEYRLHPISKDLHVKLLRIGNITLNMEHLLAIKDEDSQMILFFAGSSEANVLSVTLEGDNCPLMRAWFGRNGVNDLSTETPVFNWILQPPTVDYNKTESHRASR